ncbi:MAG: hypothetical protein ACPGU5_05090 [Lishizhenia sp.]
MNRKPFSYILLFIAGFAAGAVVVLFFTSYDDESKDVQTLTNDKPSQKVIVEHKKKDALVVSIPERSDEDSSNFLVDASEAEDTLNLDEVITESILAIKNESVEFLNIQDSTALLLDLYIPAFSSELRVEYWNSPLQLTGYELTKNKLKLFGFDPNQKITLREREDKGLNIYIDSTLHVCYKTEKFTAIGE